MQLTTQVGVPVPASAILFEAVRFAVAVAEESGGAFDPTIGHSMETRGFNREYRTGRIVQTALESRRSRQLSRRPPRSRSEDNHARSPTDPRPRGGRERPGDRHGGARAAAVRGLCDRCRRGSLSSPGAARMVRRGPSESVIRVATIELIDSRPRVERGGVHVRRLRTPDSGGRRPPHSRSTHGSIGRCRGERDGRRAYRDGGRRAGDRRIRARPRRRHSTARAQGVDG